MSAVYDADSLRRYKKQTNFFETPEVLADKMAELIDDVGLGARILEPSAGQGALIQAVQRAIKYEVQPVDFCEIQPAFCELLTQAGARKVGEDFTTYQPGPIYDAVIMNPPYRNKMAEQHLDHAWNLIKPGGKIVALVGRNACAWIDEEFSGHVFEREEIPRKTFKETSIPTYMYLICKPLGGPAAETFSEKEFWG